jgi:dimethylhistidine N-methyltransferase
MVFLATTGDLASLDDQMASDSYEYLRGDSDVGTGGETMQPGNGDTRAIFLAEVLAGLQRPEKELPCKYFYDERGSRLFEEICTLDEYYLTRTELALMNRHAAGMASCLGPGCLLVEYGSGSGQKTRLLLDHLPKMAAYVPIDLAREQLERSAAALVADYPRVEVLPLCADFTGPFTLPVPARKERRRVVYFPGSTIGNFGQPEAELLFFRVAALVGPGGGMLLGFDLRKDITTLEAAYDDARGVTAAFNLNLLARINRELGADFDLASFGHRASYNTALHCIEMHLISTRPQKVYLDDHVFPFRKGEAIRTERSYKYDVTEFSAWVTRTGLAVQRVWTDEQRFFAVLYLDVV